MKEISESINEKPIYAKEPQSVFLVTWQALSHLMDVVEEKLQSESDDGCNDCITPDDS